MKKITKLESLKLCKELWRWLEKNPDVQKKREAPIFKNRPAYLDCFACEYVYQKTGIFPPQSDSCNFCPLLKLWGHKKGSLCHCENNYNTSPWQLWKYATSEYERAKAAKEMADFCDKEIKRLSKPKKAHTE